MNIKQGIPVSPQKFIRLFNLQYRISAYKVDKLAQEKLPDNGIIKSKTSIRIRADYFRLLLGAIEIFLASEQGILYSESMKNRVPKKNNFGKIIENICKINSYAVIENLDKLMTENSLTSIQVKRFLTIDIARSNNQFYYKYNVPVPVTAKNKRRMSTLHPDKDIIIRKGSFYYRRK